MIIGLKNSIKLVGIVIISFCAVFICTLFLNYNIDLSGIEAQIADNSVKLFYDAQVMTGKVVCGITGGCMLFTSIVLLCFYIKNYIDTHKKEIGILKALGYPNIKIAKSFSVFGFSVFAGTAAGFAGAFCIMSAFCDVQNADRLLPFIRVEFHPVLIICLVLIPTAVFLLLAMFYSCVKLKMPVQYLLREKENKIKRVVKTKTELPFLHELKRSTIKQRYSLVFLIGVSSFCFSATMQMSFSMEELSSIMMSLMMMFIGIVFSCVTMFMGITSVIHSNTKTIAMMQAFGYQHRECCKAILGGYRPIAGLSFAIGTAYQFGLLKLMVGVVFKDISVMPEYNFDIKAFIITLISFTVLYELIMYLYSKRIKKISVKQLMLE